MSPRREHFRGVVWPREPTQTPHGPAHRYVVVGVLITSEPLDVDPNETAIDGTVQGVAEALTSARRVTLNHRVGDAVDVLLSLDSAWPPMAEGEPGEPSPPDMGRR